MTSSRLSVSPTVGPTRNLRSNCIVPVIPGGIRHGIDVLARARDVHVRILFRPSPGETISVGRYTFVVVVVPKLRAAADRSSVSSRSFRVRNNEEIFVSNKCFRGASVDSFGVRVLD